MNNKNKEEIYAKIFDAATNLLVWNNDLPKSIENLDIRLNKKDRINHFFRVNQYRKLEIERSDRIGIK